MYLFIFGERGKQKEKERERNISVWLPLVCPLLRTRPGTQACALTGNWTSNPWLCSLTLNPLSHISQGLTYIFYCLFIENKSVISNWQSLHWSYFFWVTYFYEILIKTLSHWFTYSFWECRFLFFFISA